MHRDRLLVLMLGACGFVLLPFLCGCWPQSRRTPIGEAGAGDRSEGAQGKAPARQAAPGESGGRQPAQASGGCSWVPLPVTAADIEHWEGEHLLIVKTRTPTRGWRVVLEVRPGSEDSVLEFVVLGVAPEGAGAGEQEPGPEARTLMHIFEIGKGIDEVVVHGAENVLVLPTH